MIFQLHYTFSSGITPAINNVPYIFRHVGRVLVSLADVLIAPTLANERLLKRAAIPFVLGANHVAVFKRVKAN